MADVVEYDVIEADVGAFMEACERRTGRFRAVHRRWFAVYTLLVFALVLALGHAPLAVWGIGLLVTAGVVMLIHPFVWQFDFRWRVRRALKQGLAASCTGRYTLSLESEGVHERGSTSERHHSWSGIQGVESDSDRIYILFEPNAGYIVPRRAFPDGATADGFAERARALWHATQAGV
jgi:hypothetical protein